MPITVEQLDSCTIIVVNQVQRTAIFEDMLTHPFDFAQQICCELGLDPERQLAIKAWAGRVQNTNNEQFVEAETSRPYSTTDHRSRIGRWRENLTEDELSMVIPMIKDTAAIFGYII